jgi:hypothetical protein
VNETGVDKCDIEGLPFEGRLLELHNSVFRLDFITIGRDSSVGIATRYGLDGKRIESRLERDFP